MSKRDNAYIEKLKSLSIKTSKGHKCENECPQCGEKAEVVAFNKKGKPVVFYHASKPKKQKKDKGERSFSA